MAKRTPDQAAARIINRWKDRLRTLEAHPDVRAQIRELYEFARSTLDEFGDEAASTAELLGKELEKHESWSLLHKRGIRVYVAGIDNGVPDVRTWLTDREIQGLEDVRRYDSEEDRELGMNYWSQAWFRVEFRIDAPIQELEDQFSLYIRGLKDAVALHKKDPTWFLDEPRTSVDENADRIIDRLLEKSRHPSAPAKRRSSPGVQGRNAQLYVRRAMGEKPKNLAQEFGIQEDAVRRAIRKFYNEHDLIAPTKIGRDGMAAVGACRQCDDFPCKTCPARSIFLRPDPGQEWKLGELDPAPERITNDDHSENDAEHWRAEMDNIWGSD